MKHSRLGCFGYIFGNVLYFSDIKGIEIKNYTQFLINQGQGDVILIVDCLYPGKSSTHFNLLESLLFIYEITPTPSLVRLVGMWGDRMDVYKYEPIGKNIPDFMAKPPEGEDVIRDHAWWNKLLKERGRKLNTVLTSLYPSESDNIAIQTLIQKMEKANTDIALAHDGEKIEFLK